MNTRRYWTCPVLDAVAELVEREPTVEKTAICVLWGVCVLRRGCRHL